nr:peptidylprolyl isomerase [uncultured Flavobacterium sp.]
MKKVLLSLICVLTISTQAQKLEDGMYANLETSKGNIIVQLEYQKTPMTVANFVSLAEGTNTSVDKKYQNKKYYDGLKFHRVISDFMIQGGDPQGNGSGGPGYKFPDEIVPELKHDKPGILSMANAGPATNGSQFFITHVPTPHLDGKHTVFGHVIEGQDVVNSIAQNDEIKSVKIIRQGKEAKKFNANKVFINTQEDIKKKEIENAKKTEIATKENLERINNAREKAIILPNGVAIYVFKKGDGKKPSQGEEVLVNYAGFFKDGSLFDTGIEEIATKFNKFDLKRKAANGYEPFPFNYGSKTGLIQGFIEGIENLNYGDQALIFIPSNLAYGERGAGNRIPPNTDLIFEIHLINKK